jgi:hypothetical protein
MANPGGIVIDVQCTLADGQTRKGKFDIRQDLVTIDFAGSTVPGAKEWEVHTVITWDEMHRWSVGGGATTTTITFPDNTVMHGKVVVLDCQYSDDTDPEEPFPVAARLVGTGALEEAARG